MTQPLNEAYSNEVLEAYQVNSDLLLSIGKLIALRIPYEEWPKEFQIAGISEDLMGRAPIKLPHSVSDPILPSQSEILNRIHNMGRIEERILSLLDEEIFENLSKHNPYWDSEHEPEGDKLHDTRMRLSCIKDNLWDIISILKNNE